MSVANIPRAVRGGYTSSIITIMEAVPGALTSEAAEHPPVIEPSAKELRYKQFPT